MNTKLKRWSQADEEYLFEYINKKPMAEICTYLDRNENAIKLKLHRHRSSAYAVLKDNALLYILKKKFCNKPEMFSPTRTFYNDVGIGQKRFWMLYKGVTKITEDELRRVTLFLEIPYEGCLDTEQLKFDFEGDE